MEKKDIMSSLEEEKEKLQDKIRKTVAKYKRLYAKIEEKKPSYIHDKLWEVRSDLELITVSIKHLYNLQEQPYKWQESFMEKKGSAKEDIAIKNLKKYKKAARTVEKLYNRDVEKCYKYLWELKETISINMKAFPQPKWEWRDGELEKQSEKVFKI